MKALSTLALVLLVPASSISSASQIEPQARFADVRLSGIMDYHHALFSLSSDDLGLEIPAREKLSTLFSKFEWPKAAEASEIPMDETADISAKNGEKNTLVMALSSLGLIGFMSTRRRGKR